MLWYISQSESNDRFEVKQCSIIASHTSLLLLQVTEGRCMATHPEVQVPSTSVLEFSLANLAVNSTKVDEYPAFLETESYKPPIYRVVLRFSEPVNPFPGSHRTKPYKEWSFADARQRNGGSCATCFQSCCGTVRREEGSVLSFRKTPRSPTDSVDNAWLSHYRRPRNIGRSH